MTQEKQVEEVQQEEPSTNSGQEKKTEVKEKKKRLCLLHSAFMPFLFFLIFGGVFYFFAYDLATIKYSDISDPRVIKIFSQYSIYAGLVFGFLSMILGYILLLIAKIVKLKRFSVTYPIIALLMNIPWCLLGRQLVYHENKYTDMGKAVIYYIGEPLLSAAVFLRWLILIWLVIVIIKMIIKKGAVKKASMAASVLILPFLLTGCVGTINEWACQFFDDPDHCYQNAAVQDGNPDACKNIKGEDFSDSGSNPPRDKCYLRIAENTGDLGVCDKIEGGAYSYTKEECILGTSVEHKNPSGCMMLSGADKESCVSQVSPSIKSGSVIDMDEQIDFLKKELKDNPDEGLQKQLDDLQKRRNDYLAVMNEENKKEYESLTDPLNKQVAVDYADGSIDEKTKNSLIALNDSLREKGDPMSEKEYKAIRDMLAYKNDPKNDIENMDAAEMVKLRWNEKVGNAVDYLKFWNANPTENEKKYDESLLIYQRMMERQAAIDKGMSEAQQDFERESGRITGYIKDEIYNKVMDEAKKKAFGELLDLVDSPASAPVTAILGEAIDTVKKEAKSAEFRGLVRAYDLAMEERVKNGMSIDQAHEEVRNEFMSNPDLVEEYDTKRSFADYGNLLRNKDCDGTNPHCLKKDIFFKAMKKSYKYQNQK